MMDQRTERTDPDGDMGDGWGAAGEVAPDRGGRGLAALSWIIVLGLVAFIAVMQNVADDEAAAPGEVARPDAISVLMGRYGVGAKSALAAAGPDALSPLIEQFDQQTGKDPASRLRGTILMGELAGAELAQERLAELQEGIDARLEEVEQAGEPHPEEARRLRTLREDAQRLSELYDDGAALNSAQRDGLVQRHGWFGELALSHGAPSSDPLRARVIGQAKRSFGAMIGGVTLAGGAALVGLVLGIIAMTQLAAGKLKRRYFPPPPGGSVYLEAFALFIVGFIVIQLLSQAMLGLTGLDMTMALVWLLPLTAFWPVIRGQSWERHRFAMGWNSGRGVVREIGAGVVGYLAGLPVFALGIALTLLFGALSGLMGGGGDGPSAPTHPILDQIMQGDVIAIVLVFILAAVWAPLTEESMFRGAFFHHLRGRMPFLPAGLVTAFIFAVVHPQGWIAVPALMSLGFVFAMLREWRGSVIAPMTAHALHNGTLVCLLTLALS